MIKVLKNINGIVTVEYEIYGKKYKIRPKQSLTIEHDGGDRHPADILLERYGFLRDITKLKKYKPTEPETAHGKKTGVKVK